MGEFVSPPWVIALAPLVTRRSSSLLNGNLVLAARGLAGGIGPAAWLAAGWWSSPVVVLLGMLLLYVLLASLRSAPVRRALAPASGAVSPVRPRAAPGPPAMLRRLRPGSAGDPYGRIAVALELGLGRPDVLSTCARVS